MYTDPNSLYRTVSEINGESTHAFNALLKGLPWNLVSPQGLEKLT